MRSRRGSAQDLRKRSTVTDPPQFVGVRRLEERPPETLVLEQPGDARKRLQVHPGRKLRGHDEEEQVCRLAVQGVEMDSVSASPERCDQVIDPVYLAVRDGHPIPDARASEAFPLHED
jgi:hypothetical protein